MKIALGQIEVFPNQPEKNLEQMLVMIEEAKRQGVDLIAFPEMAVGGYLVGDRWLEESFCKDLMRFNEVLQEASKPSQGQPGIAIAYGNVFVDDKINERVGDAAIHPNEDGRVRKYNAVYIFQNGKPVRRLKETKILPEGVQPKTLLPNYRFFDDKRYFHSTRQIAEDFGVPLEDLLQPFVINVGGQEIPVGFELCEDLWCEDYRYNGRALNPTNMLIRNGATSIVNLSSSPWTFGKNGARDRRVQFLARDAKDAGLQFVPFHYVNHTGAQNNGKNIVTFDGGSTIYDAQGLPIRFSKAAYEKELIVADDADLHKVPQERAERSKIAQKYDAIIKGIRHMKDIRASKDHPNYVIGLSGGIDSAVVAALLVMAVGPDKILAVNMPTKYNSAETKKTAEHVAANLGITYEVDEVGSLAEQVRSIFERQGRKFSAMQFGNVMAKIRGTDMLSNLAQLVGGIFTNNGNKLEVALGYATLYGDVGGAIAPLADLTKAEVYDMARYLNQEVFGREVIPETLLPDKLFKFGNEQIQPSAELEEKQIDPMRFGYHDALLEQMTDFKKRTPEDVMQWYLDGTLEQNLGISTDLIERWNIDDPQTFVRDLEWFAALVNNNVFKRVQAPPIVILSKSAYGYDIRESQLPYRQTIHERELREEVLKMDRYVPRVRVAA